MAQTSTYVVDIDGTVKDPSGYVSKFDATLKLTRVTTILHAVFSESFAGASYWGAKLGVEYGLREYAAQREPDVLDSAYEHFKKSDLAPNTVRDKAATRGTNAHKVLEFLAKGNATSTAKNVFEPEWDGYCETVCSMWESEFADIVFDDEIELIAERKLISLKWQTAGTADLLAEYAVSEERWVFDLKTHAPAKEGRRKDGSYVPGKGPAYTSELFQLDAYRCMADENGLGPIDATGVILVDDDGNYEIDERMVPYGSFKHVLDVYNAMNNVAT